MAGQALVNEVEIGVDRVLELHAARPQPVDGVEDVVGRQRDMLDALALVGAQELLDLAVFVLAFVQRDADLPVGRGHRFGKQPGRLALDVEMADLAEVEDAFVKCRPMRHAAAVHIMGQVIERVQADTVVIGRRACDRLEIDIIDFAFAGLVDKVKVRPADAGDGGNVQFHRADPAIDRGGAALHRFGKGGGGVVDPKGHGVGRRAVLVAELRDLADALHVEQEIDVALGVAADILAAVAADMGEAERDEQASECFGVGAGEFDEFKAVEAEIVRTFIGFRCGRAGHRYVPGISIFVTYVTVRRKLRAIAPARGAAARRRRGTAPPAAALRLRAPAVRRCRGCAGLPLSG